MLSTYEINRRYIENYREHSEKIEYLHILYEISTTTNMKSTLAKIYHRYSADIIQYQMFTGISVDDFLWINYIQDNNIPFNMIFSFIVKIYIVLKCKSKYEDFIFEQVHKYILLLK